MVQVLVHALDGVSLLGNVSGPLLLLIHSLHDCSGSGPQWVCSDWYYYTDCWMSVIVASTSITDVGFSNNVRWVLSQWSITPPHTFLSKLQMSGMLRRHNSEGPYIVTIHVGTLIWITCSFQLFLFLCKLDFLWIYDSWKNMKLKEMKVHRKSLALRNHEDWQSTAHSSELTFVSLFFNFFKNKI